MLKIYVLLPLLIMAACKQQPTVPHAGTATEKQHSSNAVPAVNTDSMLTELLHNKVRPDTLLQKLTRQQAVTIIARLDTRQNEAGTEYHYTGGGYTFRLTVQETNRQPGNSNTVLYHGKTVIDFGKHRITTLNDSLRETYGFNWKNTLDSPVVIEVAGRRFLYANINYFCNGKGCGCRHTLVYDIEKGAATFISNYRVPFDGYSVSDFNADGNPDLLVTENTGDRFMSGFQTVDHELGFYFFTYKNGRFVPVINQRFAKICGIKLYGIGEYGDYSGIVHSRVEYYWGDK